MRSHVLRPVLVVIAFIVILVIVRQIYVPSDFGVHARGYTYGWYRAGSIGDWKEVEVKYQGKQSCQPCHRQEYAHISDQPHSIIQCENCHGPAKDHPTDPPKLVIDRSRALCLRCHAKLLYPSSARSVIRGIDPKTHNPGFECVRCHIPHQPDLRYLQSTASRNRAGKVWCRNCHQEQVDTVVGMPHQVIECEDCHGPAQNHPSDPPKLTIDERREACLECHPNRANHNLGHACVRCHDPHRSALQFLRLQQ